MLNLFPNKEVLAKLKEAEQAYGETAKRVKDECEVLFETRSVQAPSAVARAEALVNRLANTPKQFSTEFTTYHANAEKFDSNLHEFCEQYDAALKQSTVGAGVGVAAGAATAFGAPTAAMAIATTFGTASTGTAISTLSGAAATNAALAWLGGGAITAGGGGMSGGAALLALSGPVGWVLAGGALVAGASWAVYSSHENAKEASVKLQELVDVHSKLRLREAAVKNLRELTVKHLQELSQVTARLERELPNDYALFTPLQKQSIGALVNNVHALGALLLKSPESEIPATERTQVERQEDDTSEAFKGFGVAIERMQAKFIVTRDGTVSENPAAPFAPGFLANSEGLDAAR